MCLTSPAGMVGETRYEGESRCFPSNNPRTIELPVGTRIGTPGSGCWIEPWDNTATPWIAPYFFVCI
jgi:hypothetical protein